MTHAIFLCHDWSKFQLDSAHKMPWIVVNFFASSGFSRRFGRKEGSSVRRFPRTSSIFLRMLRFFPSATLFRFLPELSHQSLTPLPLVLFFLHPTTTSEYIIRLLMMGLCRWTNIPLPLKIPNLALFWIHWHNNINKIIKIS